MKKNKDKPYGSIKHIKEAAEYLFKNLPQIEGERKIKMISYCKGIDGPKSFSSEIGGIDLCTHIECYKCRNFEKIFKEEVQRQIDSYGK